MHDDTPTDDDPFAALRPRLLRIARGRVDVAADAEDVVQDAWLRWAETATDRPDDPGAWLARVVARLCVDRLRHARVVRAHAASADADPTVPTHAPSAETLVADARATRDALAEVLGRLSPLEAAAWLLREALDADYAQVAALLARGEDACRQLVHRARERLRRRDAPRAHAPAPDTVERCLRAIRSADHRALVAALIARGDGASGRDRLHERIRCERRADRGAVLVVLGDVVLATLPLDLVAAHATDEDAFAAG